MSIFFDIICYSVFLSLIRKIKKIKNGLHKSKNFIIAELGNVLMCIKDDNSVIKKKTAIILNNVLPSL